MRRPEASFASPAAGEAAQRLGKSIQLARLARNVTQDDFSRRARISRPTLQRIERGDPAVSFTSWLSALEAASLLHLLKAASEPASDRLGTATRDAERRLRASGRRKTSASAGYDF